MQLYIYGHFVWGMSLCTFEAQEDFRSAIFVMLHSYTMKWNQLLYLSPDFRFIIMHNIVKRKPAVSMEGQYVTNTEHVTAFTLT
jgi:hypothetical protein